MTDRTTAGGPPSPWTVAGEALSGLQALRLAAATPRLGRTPRGGGRPVVLVPGLGASDLSLLPLRRFLRDRGHHARSAGLGRIDGDVDGQASRLLDRVMEVSGERNDAVALVGWSLGGVLARVVARAAPGAVRRIVTFGTPVAGPHHTTFARRYSADELRHIDALIEARRADPLTTPITAIWSRRDGIVAPAACIDRWTPGVENVEVSSTHLGLGIDPDVWRIVVERLAPGTAPVSPGP